MLDISLGIAALAGLLSFLSPCVLPLMPAYLTMISGASMSELLEDQEIAIRRRVLLNSSAFVCGFSAVFIALGATATYAGRILSSLRFEVFGLPIGLAELGGVVVIAMGLHVGGWLPIRAREPAGVNQLADGPGLAVVGADANRALVAA